MLYIIICSSLKKKKIISQHLVNKALRLIIISGGKFQVHADTHINSLVKSKMIICFGMETCDGKYPPFPCSELYAHLKI